MKNRENQFDRLYEIRLAGLHEIPRIMQFIKENWSENHILGRDKACFLYEYCDRSQVHMVVAYRRKTGELEGFLGFVCASYGEKDRDLWGSMWKVREGNQMMLGAELIRRLPQLVSHRAYLSPGINLNTTGVMMKGLRQYVDRMRHWYVLGNSPVFRIARIQERKEQEPVQDSCQIQQIREHEELEKNFDFNRFRAHVPFKDAEYIRRRFFFHPVFQYQVWGIGTGAAIDAFFVTKEVQANGAKALRIVDYVGEKRKIRGIGAWVRESIRKLGYEYVDFYEYGFNGDDIRMAGFVERELGDKNIIPNYFSPFEQKNVEIWFHAPDASVTICKADGDQDRPN